MAADFLRHNPKGIAQLADLVVSPGGHGNVILTGGHGLCASLKLAQRAEQQALDGKGKDQHQQNQQYTQADQQRGDPGAVDDLGGAQVDGVGDVPVQLRQVGDGQQLIGVLQFDRQGHHAARLLADLDQCYAHGVAVTFVDQVEQVAAAGGAGAGTGVHHDQAAVLVRLNGAVGIHDHRRDAGGFAGDEVANEVRQIQPRAGQCQHAAILVFDHHIEPDLGGIQLWVYVNVEVEALGVAQGAEKPAVGVGIRVENVARLATGGLVAAVEVVAQRIQTADEVGVVAEVLAVQLGFTEEQVGLGRVVRVA